MYKIKTDTGNLFKSYDIQELADVIIANCFYSFDFYENYKLLSKKEFVDLYFEKTKNSIVQNELARLLKTKKTLQEIYAKSKTYNCSCCTRPSVGFYISKKEDARVDYCSKHKKNMLAAFYILCSTGEKDFDKYTSKIL